MSTNKTWWSWYYWNQQTFGFVLSLHRHQFPFFLSAPALMWVVWELSDSGQGWAGARGYCRWIRAKPRVGPLSLSHTHQHPAGTVTPSCPLLLLPSDQWSWNREAGRGLRFPILDPTGAVYPQPWGLYFTVLPNQKSNTGCICCYITIHLQVWAGEGIKENQMVSEMNEWGFEICEMCFYHCDCFNCQNESFTSFVSLFE